jgi:molecular chaperone GrpE
MANDINNNGLAENGSNPLELLVSKLDTLQAEFKSKLKYDQHKEKIIDELHRELQEHKSDLIKKLLQPMIMDVIHAIDDINKLTIHYTQQAPEEIEPQKLLNLMATIPYDLEHLLYRQGIETFRSSEPVFNPNRQRALKTLPTSEPSKDKTIAQSLRQGYEWDGKIFRPEMVEVYTYQPDTAEKKEKKNE